MSGYGPNEQTLVVRILALIMLAGLLAFSGTSLAEASTPQIDQATAEARELSNLLDKLYRELEAATEEYNYAKQQFEDTQAAVKKTTAELAKAEEDLGSAQDRFSERLVGIYKAGNLGTLDVILGADSFSEAVTLLDKLKWISELDSRLVDQIETYETQRTDLKAKLEADLEQQKDYEAQTATAKQTVLDQVNKQKEALRGKEVQIAKLKKAEAERQARLAAEARARKAFLASRPGKVVSMAMDYLGVPYVWGGSSPRGFDCSGLVQYVYAKVGISLPHSSRMQFSYGRAVARGDLQAGDLVFFFTPIQHVGIYIGSGRMVNATGSQVQISDVWPASYRGARRVF